THRAELPIRLAKLLEAAELPGHVMEARLDRAGGIAGCELKQRQIVVLAAEAEKDGPALQIFMGDLESERPRVEIPRGGGVAHLEDNVSELAGLNHDIPPGAGGACARLFAACWSGQDRAASGPRSNRPGSAPVCLPSRSSTSPLTTVAEMPRAFCTRRRAPPGRPRAPS